MASQINLEFIDRIFDVAGKMFERHGTRKGLLVVVAVFAILNIPIEPELDWKVQIAMILCYAVPICFISAMGIYYLHLEHKEQKGQENAQEEHT
jgi:hypothetical protein